MAVARNLMVRAGADFSSMQKSVKKAQQDLNNFKQGVTKTMRGIGAALAATGITFGFGAMLKNAAGEAMQFEASLQQINRLMGASASEFQRWATDQAAAFGMARSEAVKYGAVYGNLLSGFSAGTDETMRRTQDLLKASAIVSSATGRSMDDVMDRIRSGLLGSTEAIEDLGINVNISLIETTKAFQRFANGKSWQQLDFNTQQTIRYFAILEQAASKYGNELAQNTMSRQADFIAQLKNAQLALGQAFLPIYNAVLPALTSMASALANVMNTIAQFTQALFGYEVQSQTQQTKSIENQAAAVEAVGDAYKEAGQKAKGAIAGFDEVNQLAEPGGSGGGTSAAPTAGVAAIVPKDVSLFNPLGGSVTEVSNKVKEAAERVRKAISEMANDPSIARLGDEYNNPKNSLSGLGTAISDFANNPAVQKFTKWIAETFKGKFLQARLSDLQIASGVIQTWQGTFEILDGIISLDFDKVIKGLENWSAGIGKSIEGFIRMFSPDMADKFAQFRDRVGEVWEAIKNISWSDIKNTIIKTWDDLKTETGAKWNTFKTFLSEKWEAVKSFIHWDDIKKAILASWDSLKTDTGTKWESFKIYLNEMWLAVKNFTNWDLIKSTILKKWDELKTETGTKWDIFKKFVKEKWDAISEIDLSSVGLAIMGAWDKIKTDTKTAWDNIAQSIKDTINTVVDAINKFFGIVNNTKITIPPVSVLGKEIIPGFTVGIPKIPDIPRLATGGITNGPMIAMIGDNPGGQEVVSPLDDLMGMISTAVTAAIQMSGANRQQSGDIVMQLDGVTFARVARIYLEREQQRLGTKVIVQPT